MSNGDEPLSAQQIHGLQLRWSEVLQKIVDDIERRKACLELAVRTATSIDPAAGGEIIYTDVVALAKGMHEFMLEPARNVTVTIKHE